MDRQKARKKLFINILILNLISTAGALVVSILTNIIYGLVAFSFLLTLLPIIHSVRTK